MVLSLLWAGILRPFRALLYDPSETRGYAKNAPPRATMSRPFRPKNVKTPGSGFPVGLFVTEGENLPARAEESDWEVGPTPELPGSAAAVPIPPSPDTTQ